MPSSTLGLQVGQPCGPGQATSGVAEVLPQQRHTYKTRPDWLRLWIRRQRLNSLFAGRSADRAAVVGSSSS